MRQKKPSKTALGVAVHRAVHQILEQGHIFPDPLALAILGEDAEDARRQARAEAAHRGMRFFVAARAQVAEANLKSGVEARGVIQLVVLGAGLDTFAYRNPYPALRVFEVDHPATQAWKRARLAEAEIAIPSSLTFAPVNFERDSLLDALKARGFDPAQRTAFTWLGVVPYLTRPAITATLSLIAGLPGGAEVTFDYSDPPETLSEEARAAQALRAARVAGAGEPFLSYFEPADLHAQLTALGFDHIDDLGPQRLFQRWAPPGAAARPGGERRDRGGHVLFAASRFAGAST